MHRYIMYAITAHAIHYDISWFCTCWTLGLASLYIVWSVIEICNLFFIIWMFTWLELGEHYFGLEKYICHKFYSTPMFLKYFFIWLVFFLSVPRKYCVVYTTWPNLADGYSTFKQELYKHLVCVYTDTTLVFINEKFVDLSNKKNMLINVIEVKLSEKRKKTILFVTGIDS